jgi:hypothetical protein
MNAWTFRDDQRRVSVFIIEIMLIIGKSETPKTGVQYHAEFFEYPCITDSNVTKEPCITLGSCLQCLAPAMLGSSLLYYDLNLKHLAGAWQLSSARGFVLTGETFPKYALFVQ